MLPKIELDDLQVTEMIRGQKRNDPRIRGGEVKITPYAVRCVRHGRRVLSMKEAGLDGAWGWFGSVDLYAEYKCPECGVRYPLDRYWYDHTKERLSTL